MHKNKLTSATVQALRYKVHEDVTNKKSNLDFDRLL